MSVVRRIFWVLPTSYVVFVSMVQAHCKFIMETVLGLKLLFFEVLYVCNTGGGSCLSLSYSSVLWTCSIFPVICTSFSCRLLWLNKQVSQNLNIRLFAPFLPVADLKLVAWDYDVCDHGIYGKCLILTFSVTLQAADWFNLSGTRGLRNFHSSKWLQIV